MSLNNMKQIKQYEKESKVSRYTYILIWQMASYVRRHNFRKATSINLEYVEQNIINKQICIRTSTLIKMKTVFTLDHNIGNTDI